SPRKPDTSVPGAPVGHAQPQLSSGSIQAACSLRKLPSRKVGILLVEPGPRKGYTGWSASPQRSTVMWSIRLRPTWSLLLAALDARSSLAFSMALAASTYRVPLAVKVSYSGEFGFLYTLYCTPSIHLDTGL